MNFTREPIVETVITPKEGYKLLLRSSKGVGQEEYFVEAVEIINFNNSIFYRSLERPRSFMIPATDFEVLEVKEARLPIKKASIEKSIKIGGGREPSQETDDQKSDRRKKRSKKRKLQDQKENREITEPIKREGGEENEETQVSSSIIRKLFPPPPTLIKEKLNSTKDNGIPKEDLPKEVEETKEILEKEIITEEDLSKIDIEEETEENKIPNEEREE